ncbi:MAG: hypothetical protein IJW92_05915 [Clostridia bacterium]|nr:hypothetical protein [Clostridia bacterium]
MKNAMVLILFLSLCLFGSCATGGYNLSSEVSSPDKKLTDLASKTYDDSTLLDIVNFDGSSDELNVLYPIECVRKLDDIYRVSYLGEDSVAVLLFDNSGNKLSGTIYDNQKSKSDFAELEKGQSLQKVRELDPNGAYIFLYTGSVDTPKISSHYTNDGYLITIEYDASNIITSICEELI